MAKSELVQGVYENARHITANPNRELSDNEKAACLIDWSPITPCVAGMLTDDGFCEHGNYGTCDQFATAPDMMVPNNYMAALHAIGYFTLSYNQDEGYSLHLEKPTRFIIKGNSILHTLANYYDKLHH